MLLGSGTCAKFPGKHIETSESKTKTLLIELGAEKSPLKGGKIFSDAAHSLFSSFIFASEYRCVSAERSVHLHHKNILLHLKRTWSSRSEIKFPKRLTVNLLFELQQRVGSRPALSFFALTKLLIFP